MKEKIFSEYPGYRCAHCEESSHIPNAETIKALEEAKAGIGLATFNSVEELFQDLDDKDNSDG